VFLVGFVLLVFLVFCVVFLVGFVFTRHRTKTSKAKSTTQKNKKTSNTDPTKNTTQKTKKMSNTDPTKNTTQKTKKLPSHELWNKIVNLARRMRFWNNQV
jgi:type III secretory pathway component EscV